MNEKPKEKQSQLHVDSFHEGRVYYITGNINKLQKIAMQLFEMFDLGIRDPERTNIMEQNLAKGEELRPSGGYGIQIEEDKLIVDTRNLEDSPEAKETLKKAIDKLIKEYD